MPVFVGNFEYGRKFSNLLQTKDFMQEWFKRPFFAILYLSKSAAITILLPIYDFTKAEK